MKYIITETINTVPWSKAISEAPATLVVLAKSMADAGQPAVFGLVDNGPDKWVILSIGDIDNKAYVAHRSI